MILTQPRTICPGVEMSTLAWTLTHQDSVTIDKLTVQSDLDNSSAEAPFSRRLQ